MTAGVGRLTSSSHPLLVKLFRIVLDPPGERVKALHVGDLRCVAPPLKRGHEDRNIDPGEHQVRDSAQQ
eukprot:4163880-Alexandrium_andersonii.AAC.1